MGSKFRNILNKIAQPDNTMQSDLDKPALKQPAEFYATTANTLATSQEFSDFVRQKMAALNRPFASLGTQFQGHQKVC